MKIAVIGSSNTDMVMSVKEFPRPGETIMGHDFIQNLGGKGANQAVACARLGGETAFIGKLGKDSLAENTFKSLSKESMDLTHLTQTDEASSGTAFIMVDSHGENSIIVDSGANAYLTQEDIDRAESTLLDASIVLMQLETPIPTLTYAAKMAHSHGIRVVLNPAPAPSQALPIELLKNVDLLIPNETEAMKISGLTVINESNLADCIRRIQQLGVGEVVITLGSKGAATLVDGELVITASPKVKPVDTTAAGDTFCGALCVRLSDGYSLPQAMQFACNAAALTCTRKGAQQSIPNLSEL